MKSVVAGVSKTDVNDYPVIVQDIRLEHGVISRLFKGHIAN